MPKFDVDDELVRKLARLLNETGLAELEFAEGEKRIRLTKGGIVQPITVAQAPAAKPALEGDETSPNTVTSPMVGTAYLSATPGGKRFISAGDTVKAGDTVLIIEAMKVMNPIKAPKGGVVKKIMVSDAQPVEFGQPLVVVE
jgi:acetyl-CoA carboxylase biotin carboxyl carrier protein